MSYSHPMDNNFECKDSPRTPSVSMSTPEQRAELRRHVERDVEKDYANTLIHPRQLLSLLDELKAAEESKDRWVRRANELEARVRKIDAKLEMADSRIAELENRSTPEQNHHERGFNYAKDN